jgi:hypothetical protein
MKWMEFLKVGMVAAACLGMLIPPPALYAADATAVERNVAAHRATVADVALADGGTLHGQVVDAQGGPISGQAVSLWQGDRELAGTTTDSSGRFQLANLRGGTYRIAVGETSAFYRLWVANTAPPSARPAALVVVDGQQVLGQGQRGPLGYWLTNPWVIAGLVAAAIAIPVAIHNDQVDRNPPPASP